MTLRRSILLAAFVLVTTVWLRPATSPQQQNTFGRCIATIPSDWGTYKGYAQGFGLVFEDSSGTLRFIKQLPCGLEGTPAVLVEIHRK